MPAEVITLEPGGADPQGVRRAARALADGALVVFPTETVYGVAASAASAEAVRRLRTLKGRAGDQPFTVHVGERNACDAFVTELSSMARRLVDKAMPGPLTLLIPVAVPSRAAVYPRLCREGVEAIYAAGSVGLRCPDHLHAAEFLRSADCPVIASSANSSGRPPPTTAEAVEPDLLDGVDLVLAGGPTRYGKGSTIVSVNGSGYQVVRQGVWDARWIDRLARLTILFVCTGNTCRSPMAEGMFRKMLAEKLGCEIGKLAGHGFVVASAGVGAVDGGRVSTEAVAAAARRGADISSHRAQALTREWLDQADYIYVMSESHLEAIARLSRSGREKARLLVPGEEISDPVGGGSAAYEEAAAKISRGLTHVLAEVPL